MKKTLLLIAFAAVATLGFAQNDKKESDRSAGLKKIASGRGEEQIRRDVEESVNEAVEELKDFQIRINGLDLSINLSSLKELDHLDEDIERDVAKSLEGLDENIEESLRSLEHLDLDFDIDIDIDDDHRGEHYRDIEEFRREALRDDTKSDTKSDKKQEIKKDVKKSPKKKD